MLIRIARSEALVGNEVASPRKIARRSIGAVGVPFTAPHAISSTIKLSAIEFDDSGEKPREGDDAPEEVRPPANASAHWKTGFPLLQLVLNSQVKVCGGGDARWEVGHQGFGSAGWETGLRFSALFQEVSLSKQPPSENCYSSPSHRLRPWLSDRGCHNQSWRETEVLSCSHAIRRSS